MGLVIAIQVAIMGLILVAAIASVLGTIGLWNAVAFAITDGEAGWKTHVTVYAAAWALLGIVAVATPTYITGSPDGSRLEFHYSKPTPTEVVPK